MTPIVVNRYDYVRTKYFTSGWSCFASASFDGDEEHYDEDEDDKLKNNNDVLAARDRRKMYTCAHTAVRESGVESENTVEVTRHRLPNLSGPAHYRYS